MERGLRLQRRLDPKAQGLANWGTPRKPYESVAMGHAVIGYLLGGWRGLGFSVQHVKIAVPSSRVSQGTLAAPEDDS
jgi:hypothetical protein